MAEAFLRKYGGDQFEAHSAGLEPKGVDEYLDKTLFQHLVTVCDDADKNCPTTWPGISNRMHWSFEDPAAFEGSDEDKLMKFRQVRDQIEARIKQWIAEQV